MSTKSDINPMDNESYTLSVYGVLMLAIGEKARLQGVRRADAPHGQALQRGRQGSPRLGARRRGTEVHHAGEAAMTPSISTIYPPRQTELLMAAHQVADQAERIRLIDEITDNLADLGLARQRGDISLLGFCRAYCAARRAYD